MKGKIKKVVSALGLALLISVPSTAYAMKGDYTIDDIGKTIQPPQYEIKDEDGDGIDDDLGIRRDSPSPEKWKESVKSQAIGGGHKLQFM